MIIFLFIKYVWLISMVMVHVLQAFRESVKDCEDSESYTSVLEEQLKKTDHLVLVGLSFFLLVNCNARGMECFFVGFIWCVDFNSSSSSLTSLLGVTREG